MCAALVWPVAACLVFGARASRPMVEPNIGVPSAPWRTNCFDLVQAAVSKRICTSQAQYFMGNFMDALKQGADALFILLGGIMVLGMHAGFAFLELGTVQKKNQVNALVKILVDFSVSTVVYFLLGYTVASGTGFMVGAEQLAERNGYDLVKFFSCSRLLPPFPPSSPAASPSAPSSGRN